MPKGMFVKVSRELRKKNHINKKVKKNQNNNNKQTTTKPNCTSQKVIFY